RGSTEERGRVLSPCPSTTWCAIGGKAGHALCSDAFEALAQALDEDGLVTFTRRKSHPPEWPAGLTDREVEILRLLAGGLRRRAMAGQLTLREHSLRQHPEHA